MTGLYLLAETAEHGEEAGGISALGLDPLAILAQAVTFLVLFWVIKKFALDKIVATLEERRKTIDKGVKLGFQMEAEKQKLDEAVEAKLQEARVEADKIIAASHQQAGEVIKAAEVSAARKVDGMIADAHVRIQEDIKKAKKDLEAETLKLIAQATEAIIDEKMDAQKDESLIRRALGMVKR